MYFCKVKQSVLIIVFLLVFKPVFPVVDYFLNYEYIAKVLCENKAKPELKCNGRCHLMKQLAKASETEKSEQKDKKSNVKVEWEIPFVLTEVESVRIPIEPLYYIPIPSYSNQYSYTLNTTFFHPPTV
ncbi:hypothetical protein [Flavobacterium sp. N1719]|uniref:hypothetical protein n=1 Tax=Flavobacterium sp. N1719 TaxID=2885633 RepID=UPI002221F410|nr:hypothetical protein [Flavobacterium sp. N1719]